MSDKSNANARIEKFIVDNRIVIIGILGALVLAAVVLCAVLSVSDSNKKKALAAIDSIEYAYVSGSDGIDEAEVAARQAKAEEGLAPYLSKKNIAGVRANMLAADIAFSRNDFARALDCYIAAAEASKKAYTYAECMYNAAVCAEETGRNEDAVKYYQAAADAKGFYLASHAVFNAGRIAEAAGNYSDAASCYKKAVDSYSGDEWADLSRSRLIDLRAKGRID